MVQTLRTIMAVARANYQVQLAYRLNFFLEFLGTMISFIVLIFLWQYLFDGQSVIGGYTKPEMMTYLLGGAILGSLLFQVSQGDAINRHIKTGRIDMYLIKPTSLKLHWLTNDLHNRFHNFFLMIPALVIVALALRSQLVGPASFVDLVLALVAVVLSIFLQYYLFTSVALWAFWADETWGPRFVLRIIAELASGKLLPLHLLPTAFVQLFLFLPFSSMLYVPLQLYLGKLSPLATTQLFLVELFWLAVSFLLFEILYRQGLRRYSAVGG